MKQIVQNIKSTILPGVLNSYSLVFFLHNRLLAVVLMGISFFNFYAGLSGLLAVLFTLWLGTKLRVDKTALRNGVYSFNALLAGLGMGTFFDPSLVYFSLLILVTLLSFFLSVSLGGWLAKYRLPHLSIPFVLSFWFVLLPSSQFEHLGLTQRNIYWMNEMYAVGGESLLRLFQYIDSLPLHHAVDIYFRSLSSVFFQSNLIAGFLIALALLYSSRIFFSLSVVGFLSAYFFAQFTGSETASITYYNIGANYMMVAFAIGGFFLIPSRQSYLWTILLIPLTSLVLLFFYKLLAAVQLPVFSLPFSLVVILFVYFLQMRSGDTSHLQLTSLQHYSPETNLYSYTNYTDRSSPFIYYPLQLPFWGEWTVSQGHDGEYTHLGEWGKAFDFVMKDGEGKSYRKEGVRPEDYYCFSKPVIAPADGIVEYVIDEIEDNPIGVVNTLHNWGNSIVLKHLDGLYTQLSHLKQHSARVKKGDYVKAGDLLALCGNSGRSPEPHLHFQMQAFPALGSHTIDYPIAYFLKQTDTRTALKEFVRPTLADKVANVTVNAVLRKAFDIIPNSNLAFAYTDASGSEHRARWEAYTDAYNYKYLWCDATQSAAYYVCDGTMFYFTSFYGDRSSLLYTFFLVARKVFLCMDHPVSTQDTIPLSDVNANTPLNWLQDLTAPFYQFIRIGFSSECKPALGLNKDNALEIDSEIYRSVLGSHVTLGRAKVYVDHMGIKGFDFESGNIKLSAKCLEN